MVDNIIHLERQSVCMGDDATAPKAKELSFSSEMLLSEFLHVIAESIPINFNGQPYLDMSMERGRTFIQNAQHFLIRLKLSMV